MADGQGSAADVITVTRDELRRAIAERFYPRIPAADVAGQARIDRQTDHFMEALGVAPFPARTEDGEEGEDR